MGQVSIAQLRAAVYGGIYGLLQRCMLHYLLLPHCIRKSNSMATVDLMGLYDALENAIYHSSAFRAWYVSWARVIWGRHCSSFVMQSMSLL